MINNLKFIIFENNEVVCTNVSINLEEVLSFLEMHEIQSVDKSISKTYKFEDCNIAGFLKIRCKYVKDTKEYFFFSGSEKHLSSAAMLNHDVRYFFDFETSYLKEIREIENRYQQSVRKLTHNLTSYVAQSLQEVELLIPQHEMVKKTWRDKQVYITSTIEVNKKETAKTVLNMAKYAQGMKTEISIYNKLLLPSPILKRERHILHRVITNSLYFFFPDFIDNEIDVEIEQSALEAIFDYESISVALYHIFSNAAKYVMRKGYMKISIKEEDKIVRIIFSMKSLQVLPNEKESIFLEGTRGTKAKLYSEGNGIGMFMIKEIIKLNLGDVSFSSKKDSLLLINGVPYEENFLEIKLPRKINERS